MSELGLPVESSVIVTYHNQDLEQFLSKDCDVEFEALIKEGGTIAAILLLGKDSTILSVLPQHKTEAIFRVANTDRYDDRNVIITNLLESYDQLMAFGQKHLNDTFHLEGIPRVSVRDHILRENHLQSFGAQRLLQWICRKTGD